MLINLFFLLFKIVLKLFLNTFEIHVQLLVLISLHLVYFLFFFVSKIITLFILFSPLELDGVIL